jgi:hypothetical protein
MTSIIGITSQILQRTRQAFDVFANDDRAIGLQRRGWLLDED